MSPDRHARVKEVFLRASELDEDRRDAYLAEACGDDEPLRREVESLLRHHDSETILEPPSPLPGTGHAIGPRSRPRRRGLLREHRALLLAALVAAVMLAAVGRWTVKRVNGSLRQGLAEDLRTILDSNIGALELWVDAEEDLVESMAALPAVRTDVAGLLFELDSGAPDLRARLLASPHLAALEQVLDGVMQDGERWGWAAVAREGVIVAASERGRGAVGLRLSGVGEALLAPAFAGEAIVTMPYREARLVQDWRPQRTEPVMALVAPLPAPGGADPHAVLLLGVAPDQDFTRILSVAQRGESGETYAFDRTGTLISESRFDEQLREIGILPDDPQARSIMHVQVRDPGGDLTAGHRPAQPLAACPFTRMARSALEGEAGVDVDGYRDYRGVMVVGAWRWLPGRDFGVATELDREEAYGPMRYLRGAFGLLLALLGLAVGATLLSSHAARRLRRDIAEVQRLGQYTLVDKIGEGGVGVVYRAEHAMLKRPTAIKLLKPDRVTDEAIKRFEREVQLTSQLAHPNTIAIYDYGRTPEDVFYYAMEYLDGVTLTSLVGRAGPLPPERVVYLIEQVCGSLEEAHAVGLIHRDIKPLNIMVCRRADRVDVVKVLDFGLVKNVEKRGRSSISDVGSLSGTPPYIAPERLEDPSAADARCDLYAVGAVAYYALTGQETFGGQTAMDVCLEVLNEEPPRPSGAGTAHVPEGLDQLVFELLAKEPEKRPQSAREVLDRLGRLPEHGRWSRQDALGAWS